MSSGCDALELQVGLEDLVGGARIDVVGAGQHPALHLLLAHQVVDRRDRLLVRRRAGVEHVAAAFLALGTGPGRTGGRSAPRTPAAPTCATPRSSSRTPRRICRPTATAAPSRRTAASSTPDRPPRASSFLPSSPPFLFCSVDQHQHDVLQRRLADRHGAGQRVQDADLDGAARRRGLCRGRRDRLPGRAHGGQRERGGAEAAQAATGDRGIARCHDCLSCFPGTVLELSVPRSQSDASPVRRPVPAPHVQPPRHVATQRPCQTFKGAADPALAARSDGDRPGVGGWFARRGASPGAGLPNPGHAGGNLIEFAAELRLRLARGKATARG